MSFLGEYIVRLLCCALLSNIILSLLSDGIVKYVMRLVTGIFLTITVISPFRNISIPKIEDFDFMYLQQGQTAASIGEDFAEKKRIEIIKSSLEEYILDKASMLGCDLSVQIEMDEEGCPVGIVLSGEITTDIRRELEMMLTEDLGISKGDLRWIG